MSYTGNVIKAPVSIHDVQQALGNSSGDLATLCTASNIKTWARFRPIEPVTSRYVQQLSSSQRSSASVNYGIKNIPAWYNGETFAQMVLFWTGQNMSSTNYPTGYSSIPQEGWWAKSLPSTAYRLTDFVDDSDGSPTTKGYYSAAEPPIGEIDHFYVEQSSGLVTVQYKQGLGSVSDGLTITYSDLAVMNNLQFQNMYFGIAIRAVVGTSVQYFIATQDNKVGLPDGSTDTLWGMGATVRFKIGSNSGNLKTLSQSGGSFEIFPIICNSKHYYGSSEITTGSSINNLTGTFVALMPKETVTVSILVVKAIIVSFTAWRLTSSNSEICYLYTLRCTDESTYHDFDATVEALDSSGNSVLSVYHEPHITAGGSYTSPLASGKSYSVMNGQYTLAATSLKLTVAVDAQDSAAYKQTVTQTVPITIGPSPYA